MLAPAQVDRKRTESPELRDLLRRMAKPQRHRLLHGYPLAQAIVDHQQDFLDKGPEAIEPLKMQQIADKVGVHVTTVSRAVDDKWIQTPRGIFPLKRFFCGGTVAADGEEVAWDAVRLKLQEVVDNEDKSHPLNDEELSKALAKVGMKVARRTVSRYRKAMNIPSARQRREWPATSSDDDGETPRPTAFDQQGSEATSRREEFWASVPGDASPDEPT